MSFKDLFTPDDDDDDDDDDEVIAWDYRADVCNNHHWCFQEVFHHRKLRVFLFLAESLESSHTWSSVRQIQRVHM